MGMILEFRCVECGYRFNPHVGAGMLYSAVYEETVEKALAGKLGKTLKTFLTEHPEGVINCEDGVVRCEKCGWLMNRKKLTMYLPKRGYSRGAHESVLPWELHEHYRRFARYPHRCGKCRGSAVVIGENELFQKTDNGQITCPVCSGQLQVDGGVKSD